MTCVRVCSSVVCSAFEVCGSMARAMSPEPTRRCLNSGPPPIVKKTEFLDFFNVTFRMAMNGDVILADQNVRTLAEADFIVRRALKLDRGERIVLMQDDQILEPGCIVLGYNIELDVVVVQRDEEAWNAFATMWADMGAFMTNFEHHRRMQ